MAIKRVLERPFLLTMPSDLTVQRLASAPKMRSIFIESSLTTFLTGKFWLGPDSIWESEQKYFKKNGKEEASFVLAGYRGIVLKLEKRRRV